MDFLSEPPFEREVLQRRLQALAANGVFVGTSSWKYPGWVGQVYTSARYEFRGRFANTRFEKDCLSEYAEVFKTVCVDAGYYAFPTEKHLHGLASQVPDDFRFGFKVTDTITLKRFPQLPRFGPKAGTTNPDFLNPELFENAFLKPCLSMREKVGVLMFEFSKFHRADYEHGRNFLADLDQFLTALPTGWPYAIEMRNRSWLTPEYFACLNRHNVAHVFNSWTQMPPVEEQLALPGSRTTPSLVAARFLLKPGRKYADAVEAFQPYAKVKEPIQQAREAGTMLILEGATTKKKKTFIYVNNRMEGNAIGTIQAMLS